MFESYSIRAKQVRFLARLESGARGAEMLDIEDLLAGLIIEDQNAIPSALAGLGMRGEFMNSPEHDPFLPPATASKVRRNLQIIVEKSRQKPTNLW